MSRVFISPGGGANADAHSTEIWIDGVLHEIPSVSITTDARAIANKLKDVKCIEIEIEQNLGAHAELLTTSLQRHMPDVVTTRMFSTSAGPRHLGANLSASVSEATNENGKSAQQKKK